MNHNYDYQEARRWLWAVVSTVVRLEIVPDYGTACIDTKAWYYLINDCAWTCTYGPQIDGVAGG